MYLKKVDGPRAVALSDGTMMTLADLPVASTRRWVASRKAAVLRGINSGLISRQDAIVRWSLSNEELDEWQNALDAYGERALKATNVQIYRQP